MTNGRPCEHLAAAAAPLLSAGAVFLSVAPSNGEAAFVHHLSKGPVSDIAQKVAATHGVEYWRDSDAHYDLDSGFICRSCKLAISWPQEHETIYAL